ncbi:MAG TPA: hypothetical protein VH640_11235 [Bryobacteraceae bacterium]|jgi:hypothetical protein
MVRIFFFTVIMATVGAAQDIPQNIPGLAGGILAQSKLAQQAVLQHDKAAALDHIRQGSASAAQILQATPPSAPRPVLVRIYKSTETTTTYAPAKRNGRLKKYATAAGTETQITTGRLDVSSAATRLQDAEAAVERDDWTTANSDLRAIPESVIQTTVQGNMPLLEARQNLRLAKMRVEEGHYKDAAVPLRAAADDLADYEHLSPGALGQNAEYFRQQIANYAGTIAKNHQDAAMQIDYWLGYVDKWYKEATTG